MSPATISSTCLLLITIFHIGEQQFTLSFTTRPGVNREDCPKSAIGKDDGDANICEEIFTSFGPFCSMVIVTNGNIQRCDDRYAEETCNFCLSLQQQCGSLVGSIADICKSRNAGGCSFEFLRSCSAVRGSNTDCDYCEVVFSICKVLPGAPTAATTEEPSFCSMIFESIGPFCQHVIQPKSNSCQDGFSISTCNTCRNVLQSCNDSLVGDVRDICRSNLAYLCAFSQPDSTTFLVKYCSVVQDLCNKQLSGSGGSLSGSGIGSGSGVSGSGSAVSGSGSASGSGSGDQCYLVRNSFGQLCTAVLQSPTCELVYSRDTCDRCQIIASMCAPLDSNMELFCEQEVIDCESIIDNCFSVTKPSFECDYCAFYANSCFRGREIELCDITNLLTGCNRALSTDYPCMCFFTTDICALCNNLQRICPPNNTTTTDSILITTTAEATTVSDSTQERTFTEPSTVQLSSMVDLTTTKTMSPLTTMAIQEVPVVTLALDNLTVSQQENAITTIFSGLEEDQFLESGVGVFLEQIALLVNTYEGTLQQKQQVAQVSPDDVLLIGSPVMSNDELVIAFVVLGQNGDPINGSILATAVEEGGNQLASALSTATGASVQFIRVIEGIILQPLTTTSIVSTILQPLTTISVVLEGSSQLSDGAIAAIVLIVVLVTVTLIVVMLIVAVIFVRQRSRRKKYILDNIAGTSRVTNTYQTVDQVGGKVDDEQPPTRSDICLQGKSESPIVPSTAYNYRE